MFGGQTASAVSADEGVVDQTTQFLIGQLKDLGDLMGSAEAVEKVDERYAGFERGRLRNGREVMRLLHRSRGNQAESGLADGHDVLVIAENRQGLGGNGPRRHMEHCAGELAGDLV